jgi:hypothetical protein
MHITNEDGSLNEWGWKIVIVFGMCVVIAILIGLMSAAFAAYDAAQRADPQTGFLYQDNPVAAIALGCAIKHDPTKDKLILKNGKYDVLYSGGTTYYFYNPDTIFDDMQGCLNNADIPFRFVTNKAVPNLEILHAIFRRCTDSKISSGWFHNQPYIQKTLACMIKNGLTFSN